MTATPAPAAKPATAKRPPRKLTPTELMAALYVRDFARQLRDYAFKAKSAVASGDRKRALYYAGQAERVARNKAQVKLAATGAMPSTRLA